MTGRVLVAGSRELSPESRNWIRRKLSDLAFGHGRLTVVQGGAPGADAVAAEWARQAGHDPETWRPDWDGPCASKGCRPGHRVRRADGATYCPLAGFERNRRMVAEGADVAVVVHELCRQPRCVRPQPHGTHGTEHTLSLLHKAGIRIELRPAWSARGPEQITLEGT